MRRLLLSCLLAVLAGVVVAPSSQAAFGIEEFALTFEEANGSAVLQTGSHPFAVTSNVRFHTIPDPTYGELPQGATKDLDVELPAGLVGDPSAVPRCSNADFINIKISTDIPGCSDSSAVGIITVKVITNNSTEIGYLTAPVYDLVAPAGSAEKLGFAPYGVPIAFVLDVKNSPPYNVVAKFTDTSQVLSIFSAKLVLWGNPASPVHNSLRGHCLLPTAFSPTEEPYTTGEACTSGVAEAPFITLPRECEPLSASFLATSWQQFPAVTGSVEVPTLSGCEHLGFGPTIAMEPTKSSAGSESGLNFSLDVHDEGLTNTTGLAQSDIRRAEVALPQGMTVNPSAANGLGACTNADLARETLAAAPGEGCPGSSKLGTVEVETPLLEETLGGSIFIAAPYENEFGTLLAAYIVIKSQQLGIMIKQPLKIVLNPVTGRLTTIADNIPQLPFSHFRLKFRDGEGAPLVTPPACGTYNTTAKLTPWSGGSQPVTTSSMFQIVSGINGGACSAGGVPPFAPEAVTGTLNDNAGNYAPLDLRISRKDGEQELTRFSTILPPGLTGNLSGIPFCPDSAIETARHKTGTQEQNEPSCPQASEIGHTLVGAGVGTGLAWAPGKIYLAGPYNGSPLSVVSITSAKVGPFDLGTVVIRFGLHIDPNTAQVSVDSTGSDPIPHIIDGIIVNVREIHAYIDRNKFILNPTNCNPMGVQNIVSGAGSDLASPTDDMPITLDTPFQAADCTSLAFKPSFAVSTSGKTSKANGASLTVKLAYPNAPQGTQSNIHLVKVELPKQLPSRLTTLQKACTAAQFHANPAGCPAASVVGHAKAITPILPVPLEGPAYFVSNGGEAFPNLIMVLQGYGITIDLTGSTFISKQGITSSTFKTVPDQPVTSFELTLPQGPYSALSANGNLCTSKLTMPTEFIGQNGMLLDQTTKVTVTGCPKTKTLTRAQKLALALKACHKKPKGPKRKTCEHQARRRYGPVKKKGKK